MTNGEQTAAMEQAAYEGWPVIYYVRTIEQEAEDLHYIERELDDMHVYVIFYSDESKVVDSRALF